MFISRFWNITSHTVNIMNNFSFCGEWASEDRVYMLEAGGSAAAAHMWVSGWQWLGLHPGWPTAHCTHRAMAGAPPSSTGGVSLQNCCGSSWGKQLLFLLTLLSALNMVVWACLPGFSRAGRCDQPAGCCAHPGRLQWSRVPKGRWNHSCSVSLAVHSLPSDQVTKNKFLIRMQSQKIMQIHDWCFSHHICTRLWIGWGHRYLCSLWNTTEQFLGSMCCSEARHWTERSLLPVQGCRRCSQLRPHLPSLCLLHLHYTGT